MGMSVPFLLISSTESVITLDVTVFFVCMRRKKFEHFVGMARKVRI